MIKTAVVANFYVFDTGDTINYKRQLIYLTRIGEPWNSPWSSSLMATAEWQAAAVLASMTPSQASSRARPKRKESKSVLGTGTSFNSKFMLSPDGIPLKEALRVFGNSLGDGESEEERWPKLSLNVPAGNRACVLDYFDAFYDQSLGVLKTFPGLLFSCLVLNPFNIVPLYFEQVCPSFSSTEIPLPPPRPLPPTKRISNRRRRPARRS